MDRKKTDLFSIISVLLFLGAAVFFLLNYYQTVDHFADTYHEAMHQDSYAGKSLIFTHDDYIISHNFGLEMPDNEAEARLWLEESLPGMREWFTEDILSCILYYSALSFSLFHYYLYKRNEQDAGRHYIEASCGILIYTLIFGAVSFLPPLTKGFLPKINTLGNGLVMLSQILVLPAASALYAYLIRHFRFRRILTVLLAGLTALFLFGTVVAEGLLIEEKTFESFDYLVEKDARYADPEYADIIFYDEDAHQLHIGDDVYDPEIVQNENYAGGLMRIILIAWEIIDPLAGIGRSLVEHDLSPGRIWVPIVYILKSLGILLIMRFLFMRSVNEKQTEEENYE